ncbi:346_t:CDS:2, partial [Entrophospora sp. SA101]
MDDMDVETEQGEVGHCEEIISDNELLDEQVFVLPRNHTPQAYLDMSNTDMASMDIHLPENNIGYRLLTKMGWKAGQGLGSFEQGRREPIRIDIKSDSLG